MPHEFPFYGHDSCNASLTGPDNSSRSRSSLIHVPATTTATKPLVMASTTAAAKGYSASPPTSAPGATTAPRKPSQLGLFCTDKENGRRSGNGFGVVSGAGQSVAAASATTRQVPNPPPGPTAPASLAAYGHGHTPNPKVPKHIYDSAMKTFYSVVKFLGKGGFACCYEIVSDATGKHYAAKIVPKESIQKPKQKNKLLQEVKIHQSLRHDSIVRLYRVFEDADNVYIIMELCENQTMMEYIKRKGRMSDDEAKGILLQLLAAMQYLHENHVIHRDLKLGNLFLKAGPTVKLGDFGLATLVYGEDDRKRTICGTPNYIAPEIIAGGEKGHSFEVDIWSFGVIMYTLLVGRPPFQKQEVKEIYEKIKVANFDFPPHLSISLAAKDLINRLLHPDPEKRPRIPEIREHSYFTGKPLASLSTAMPNSANSTAAAADNRQLPSSGGSGLIMSVKMATERILSNYSGQGIDIEQINQPNFTYLLKCHDFSSKYGIAYVVSDGSKGCYFNDGTSLVVTMGQKLFYFQPGNQDGVLVRESFYCPGSSLEDIQSEDVRLRMKILAKLDGILAVDQHEAAVANRSGGSSEAEPVVFLMKHFKSPQATFYRLSNRVLQVNFFDGSRLLFTREGRGIVFVDSEQQRSSTGQGRCLAFSSSTSRVHLSSQITGKLQYVHDMIQSIMRGNK